MRLLSLQGERDTRWAHLGAGLRQVQRRRWKASRPWRAGRTSKIQDWEEAGIVRATKAISRQASSAGWAGQRLRLPSRRCSGATPDPARSRDKVMTGTAGRVSRLGWGRRKEEAEDASQHTRTVNCVPGTSPSLWQVAAHRISPLGSLGHKYTAQPRSWGSTEASKNVQTLSSCSLWKPNEDGAETALGSPPLALTFQTKPAHSKPNPHIPKSYPLPVPTWALQAATVSPAPLPSSNCSWGHRARCSMATRDRKHHMADQNLSDSPPRWGRDTAELGTDRALTKPGSITSKMGHWYPSSLIPWCQQDMDTHTLTKLERPAPLPCRGHSSGLVTNPVTWDRPVSFPPSSQYYLQMLNRNTSTSVAQFVSNWTHFS